MTVRLHLREWPDSVMVHVGADDCYSDGHTLFVGRKTPGRCMEIWQWQYPLRDVAEIELKEEP